MNPVPVIRTWGEMVRFSHSVFALPFALMATFLAGRQTERGLPMVGQLALIILCMVAARSFAMTFNRIADAALDARNPRTARRPLQTGRITVRQAWLFLAGSAALFGVGCLGFQRLYANPWPIYLAGPTLLALAVYSYAKRVTPLTHWVLSAVIGFAPVAAWIAVDPASLGWPVVILMGVVSFWMAGFDIIYACQDVEVDRRDKLFSVPAALGVPWALFISRACHVLTVGLLAGLGLVAGLGWVYWMAAGVTAVLLAAEQAVVSPKDLSRVNLAFFTINGCVSLLLGTATIVDVLLRGAGR
ncbi:MAG TPA: UbiA-like polyprenyltransferase [Phycisphaerae bacterium]|nr:UbiA-like polyprenyltransferase [Phycisphaerae bacterium]